MELIDKVNVIIPIWKTDKSFLTRCLASLISNRVDMEVTLVISECEVNSKDYDDVINIFKDILDINVIKSVEKLRPGQARQLGLNSNTCKYIFFLDSDDTITNKAIEILYKRMEDEIAVTGLRADHHGTDVTLWPNDDIFCTGLLINYEMWLTNDIKFHEDLPNAEDSHIARLLQASGKITMYEDLVCYNYLKNPSSDIATQDISFGVWWSCKSYQVSINWLREHNRSTLEKESIKGLLFYYCKKNLFELDDIFYEYFKNIWDEFDVKFKWRSYCPLIGEYNSNNLEGIEEYFNSNTKPNMDKVKVCLILLAMGDEIYPTMTINTIRKIKELGFNHQILVMTEQKYKNMDGYLGSKWVVIPHKYDHIKDNHNEWLYCGDKYFMFDVAKSHGFDAFIFMDSDILIRSIWEINDIIKILEDDPNFEFIYMPGDNSDYFRGLIEFKEENRLVPRFNSGFIGCNIRMKPDEEEYNKLLRTYSDQDTYSILWEGKIIPYTAFGFRNMNVTHFGTHGILNLIQPEPIYNYVGFKTNQEIDIFRKDMEESRVILKKNKFIV